LGHNAPRLLGSLGAWLTAEIQGGRLRDMPLPLLIQQLIAPIAIHMLLRPTMPQIPGMQLPDLETVCDTFTDAFLRAATVDPPVQRRTRRRPR
jgi:hypothetical protein